MSIWTCRQINNKLIRGVFNLDHGSKMPKISSVLTANIICHLGHTCYTLLDYTWYSTQQYNIIATTPTSHFTKDDQSLFDSRCHTQIPTIKLSIHIEIVLTTSSHKIIKEVWLYGMPRVISTRLGHTKWQKRKIWLFFVLNL